MLRQSDEQKQEWSGSGAQMMAWHYKASLGRYFNNPEEILPMVKTMSLAGQIVFWVYLLPCYCYCGRAAKTRGQYIGY